MSTALRLCEVLRRRLAGVCLLLGLTLTRLLTTVGLSSAVANELYLLVVTGVVLTWCLQALVATQTSERLRLSALAAAGCRVGRSGWSPLEESVPYWIGVAGLRHHRLRPEVTAVAAERLTRLGVDLRTDPRARQALGPVVWELIRLDVPTPTDEHAPGLTMAQVDDIIAILEALERPDFAVPHQSGDQA